MVKSVKFIVSAIIIVGLYSCSIGTKKTQLNKKNKPLWLSSPNELCEKELNLCAVGEGDNYKSSDADAYTSLASYFSVKINSQLNIKHTELTSGDFVEIQEIATNELEKQVDTILETAQITNKFNDGSRYYSLVKLDKIKLSKLLDSRIDELDKKIFYFYGLNNKLYVKKIYALFQERTNLNEHKILVDGKSKKINFSLEQVETIKQSSENRKIKLKFSGEISRVLKQKIQELFEQLGYQVTNDGTASYVIAVNLKVNELYLNVRAFKKYELILNLVSKDNDQKRLGSVLVSLIDTGRNKLTVLSKSREALIEKIENKITQLNLN